MKKLLALSFVALVFVACNKQEPAQTETAPAASVAKVDLNVAVEPVDAGKVEPVNGQYDQNSQINLTAIPNPGFAFDRWEGDVLGNTNPVTVTLDAPKTLKAIFKPAEAAAPAAQ